MAVSHDVSTLGMGKLIPQEDRGAWSGPKAFQVSSVPEGLASGLPKVPLGRSLRNEAHFPNWGAGEEWVPGTDPSAPVCLCPLPLHRVFQTDLSLHALIT